MDHDNPTRIVQLGEVAESLGISERSARRGVERGDIPSFQVNGRSFVPRPSWESILRGDRVMPGRGRVAVEACSAAAATGATA